MSRPRVCAIIVNWNLAESTMHALKGVFAQQVDAEISTFVVDNGSDDADYAKLRTFMHDLPRTRLLRSPENTGFTGGVNLAVQQAVSELPDFYLLVNNDADLSPKALGELLEVAHDSGAAITGARIVDSQGRTLFHGRQFPGELFGLWHERTAPGVQWKSTGRVDGAAMLIAATLVQQRLTENEWLLDPAYFLYWEDVDLCAYASSKGKTCAIASNAIVFHAVAASSGGIFNPRGTYYQTRNRIFIARRWLPPPQLLLFHAYFVLSRIGIQVARSPFGRSRWRAVARGMLDGYRGVDGRSPVDW